MYFSNIHRSYEYRGTRKGDGCTTTLWKYEKNKGKGNSPLLAARNPDEGPRRFPQRTVVYRVLSVWIPEWIPQYVNLYVSLCPYYRYDILCEDKLLRKYITDITPMC